MNIIISNSSSTPIYEQIKQAIKQSILNEELREEDILPSVRVMENNIEVNNLSKKYEGFELKNINFVVPKGSIVGFVGENGAGKTTTIKSILNITNAEGNIKILGQELDEPTSGLDPVVRSEILDIFRKYIEEDETRVAKKTFQD